MFTNEKKAFVHPSRNKGLESRNRGLEKRLCAIGVRRHFDPGVRAETCPNHLFTAALIGQKVR